MKVWMLVGTYREPNYLNETYLIDVFLDSSKALKYKDKLPEKYERLENLKHMPKDVLLKWIKINHL